MENRLKYPLVSVGIPTFNGSGNLVKAIGSVISQSYPNLEIIISDNSSTDDTRQVCLALCTNYSGIIRYFRQESNIGLVANYEFVLKQATGDFFMWLADDDTIEPGALQEYVAFLIKHPDYSLVSGQIRYWLGDRFLFYEKDFNLEHTFPHLRVASYYFKVVHGALYYGLMNRRVAEKIPVRNRIGDDWHFVATLAFIGKIKNLDCVGYNKKFGGVSASLKHYARVIGASWLSGNFPHASIAFDAFADIVFKSPVYSREPVVSRVVLGLASCLGVLLSHYFKIYPLILGGKIKRTFGKPHQWLPSVQKE